MKRTVCIIPARMASSRFPGKPLAPLLGMPLILHVWHRCRLAKGFDAVYVATCDREIYDCVTGAGGLAVMTAGTHERCTDRTEEAVRNAEAGLHGDDLVVMVQGDEILVSPEVLDQMIAIYRRERLPAVNLLSRITKAMDHDDPNVVKAVTDVKDRIVFFSRSPIPSRARSKAVSAYQQTGVLAYAWSFLEEFARLPQTPMEIAESIDMLRLIEHGIPLQAVKTEVETIGVDTESDRARAEQVLLTDPVTERYIALDKLRSVGAA